MIKNSNFVDITASNQDKMEVLKETCEFKEKELETLREELKTQNLFITDRFGTYLGREFLDPKRLDALADIIQNGTAANLSEAIEEYKKRNSGR